MLACDLGELLSLSEPQFPFQSSGPGLINLGKAPAVEPIATGDQLPPAGQQSPPLGFPGMESPGGKSVMAAPLSPTHEEATELLLLAKNTQQL